MTTYNTGNALGSTDPRDLYDNSQVFDELVNNTTDPTVQDRFGNTRITLANQLGYNFKGDYAAGIELISYTDIIRYNSEFYRPSASATLPYTTTATLPDVDSNLVPVGDANLRQELALPSATSGSDLISHTGTTDTVTEALDRHESDINILKAAFDLDTFVDSLIVPRGDMNFSESFSLSQLTAPTPGDPLDIPTYVSGNDEIVHPSVVYAPGGFNGYQYWMCATPYAGTDNQVENPSIYASYTERGPWVVPPGATNPLVVEPDGTYHNSDPCLFFDKLNRRLYLMYRRVNGEPSPTSEDFLIMSSTDGVNWTTPAVTLALPDINAERGLSPSIVYLDRKYYMWTLDPTSTPAKVWRRESVRPEGPWTDKTECAVLRGDKTGAPNNPIWHLEVRNANRRLLMLAQEGDGAGGDLAFYSSEDIGLEWVRGYGEGTQYLAPVSGWTNGGLYKASFIFARKNNAVFVQTWIGSSESGSQGWRIGFTEAALT